MLRYIVFIVLLLVPRLAYPAADMIMGVDSVTGVPEALSGEDAAVIIGTGTSGLDGNFDISGGNTITDADESKPLYVFGSGGQNTSGVAIYRHSSGRTIIRCVEAGVIGPCDIITELTTSKSWLIKNNAGTVILKLDESTGKFSTFTIDGEDAGVSITLFQPLCGGDLVGVDPASGTAGHIWDKSPLDTAPTATAVTGTNQTYGVARFPDSDGDYGVQLTCFLPQGLGGSVDAVAWGKTTGTGNFRLQIATVCYATDEANDAAFNTSSKFTMAAGTSGRLNRYSLTGITVTGCASNEMLVIRVFRNRTEASDTLNNTFDLKSVRLWVRNTY